MMLTKLPRPLPEILEFIDASDALDSNWRKAARDRCLYICRLSIKTKDLVKMTVSDVLNPDLSIRRFFMTADGTRYDLDRQTQDELLRYLNAISESLDLLPRNQALFSTQKSPRFTFSANTLQGAYSAQDKRINQFFSRDS